MTEDAPQTFNVITVDNCDFYLSASLAIYRETGGANNVFRAIAFEDSCTNQRIKDELLCAFDIVCIPLPCRFLKKHMYDARLFNREHLLRENIGHDRFLGIAFQLCTCVLVSPVGGYHFVKAGQSNGDNEFLFRFLFTPFTC